MKNKKNILITGTAGFIGSNLAKKLLDDGQNVVGLDNFLDNYEVSFKQKNITLLKKFSGFEFYECNILDIPNLESIFHKYKFDVVIHLAARAGIRPSLMIPADYFETNVVGTINILEQMKKHKVDQFIFASSSSVYGNNTKTPFKENDRTDHPVSPYGASKKSAEVLCASYAYLYNIKTTVFRFFSVYGRGGRPDMAPYLFSKAILNNQPIHMFGESIQRDYTNVQDIVEGIVAGINNPFKFEIINLGNNSPISLENLITLIEKNLHKKAKVEIKAKASGDVNITYADIRKAKKLLGWESKISIEQGIKSFTNWIQKL